MLHFEEQRITAEAAEPVAQIHGCFRRSRTTTETTRAARRALRPRSDTFLELTLIVGNGPAYTGMRLETVIVSSVLGRLLRSPPQSAMRLGLHKPADSGRRLSEYEPRLIARDRFFQELRSGGRALRKQRVRKIHVERNGFGPAPRCCLLLIGNGFRAVRVKDINMSGCR